MVARLAAALALLLAFAAGDACAETIAQAIAAAVADPGRPEADLMRDANRKPADVLKFAGVRPGDAVAEFLPGQFYFTRILSKLVGPKGHVYVLMRNVSTPNPLADDPRYANVSIIAWKGAIDLPQPIDMVWTSDNYHDFFNIPGVNPARVDQQVFADLKPGGVYLVLDHHAAAGAGSRDTASLHRIDPETVKSDVMAAGFVLEADSDLLRRAADTHTLRVQDPAIRGLTDQFILKFRKPRSAEKSTGVAAAGPP